MKLTLAVALSIACVAGSACAQPATPGPEAKALHEAVLKRCAADQKKFCSGLQGKQGHDCMAANLPKASQACQAAIARMAHASSGRAN